MALRSRVLAAVAAALPLALAAGCSGGTVPAAQAAQAGPGGGIPAGPAPGPQALSETGSTLLYPVLRNWAAAYRQQHPNVSIATAATGSGKGIAEASAGQVDIGASDAYLSSGDLVTDPAMVNIPLAVSAQQVNYNVPGLRPAGIQLKLNGKILALMYLGVITSWNDPRIAAINPGVTLPGCEFTERGLRFGLERSYRARARLAPDRHRRIELVEAANSVRPRTWV